MADPIDLCSSSSSEDEFQKDGTGAAREAKEGSRSKFIFEKLPKSNLNRGYDGTTAHTDDGCGGSATFSSDRSNGADSNGRTSVEASPLENADALLASKLNRRKRPRGLSDSEFSEEPLPPPLGNRSPTDKTRGSRQEDSTNCLVPRRGGWGSGGKNKASSLITLETRMLSSEQETEAARNLSLRPARKNIESVISLLDASDEDGRYSVERDRKPATKPSSHTTEPNVLELSSDGSSSIDGEPMLDPQKPLLMSGSRDPESDNSDSSQSTDLGSQRAPFRITATSSKKSDPTDYSQGGDLLVDLDQSDAISPSLGSSDNDDDGVAFPTKCSRIRPRHSSDNGNGATSPSARLVPCPKCPTISNEILNRIGGKLYPDLRHAFIHRLLRHAKDVRRNSYQKVSFDVSVRAIVMLSLHPFPIRSPEEATNFRGVGEDLVSILREASKSRRGRRLPYHPSRGKFSAVAPAAILALYSFEQKTTANDEINDVFCPMEDLIMLINTMLDPQSMAALTKTPDYYLEKNTMDPGWAQIKKTCSPNIHAGLGALIKQRKKKNRCPSGIVYELTDEGRIIAKRLERTLREGPIAPGPLRQLLKDEVDREFGSVTISMDFREGGGGSKSLHKMCDNLEREGVPYVVRELKIADYLFFVGDLLAPMLVERKSVDDVAASLVDGRWERQQRQMRKAQYVLGGQSQRKCSIGYLIEGSTSQVTGHEGKVGRASWNQTEKDVEDAIDALPRLGFWIIRSKGVRDSMFKIARIAKDLAWKEQNGSIDARYTYDQFLSRIKLCDKKEGDIPTEIQHQYPAAPVVDMNNARYERRCFVNSRPGPPGHAAQADSGVSLMSHAMMLNPFAPCEEELQKESITSLKTMLKARAEKTSGSKADLIARLRQPPKPALLITRARNGEYVPKSGTCNAALLVALLLNTRPGEGLPKERLIDLADTGGVSNTPMDQKSGYFDGWSGMSALKNGDPALVILKKKLYCLSTQPPGSSGRDVARAVHILAHREGRCKCGNVDLDHIIV